MISLSCLIQKQTNILNDKRMKLKEENFLVENNDDKMQLREVFMLLFSVCIFYGIRSDIISFSCRRTVKSLSKCV